jgi:broad specificity phosphatase PhoE
MKIILFRHGEKQKSESTDDNIRRSVCLTPKGIKQIKALGEHLKTQFPKTFGIDCIYTSPFTRTVQSAEIIREILSIKEIIPVQELEEFYPIDDYTMEKEYRQELMKKALINPEWIGPNGKSLKTSLDEFESFLRNVPASNIAIVSSHGALIRNLVYRLSPELRPPDEEIVHSGIKEGGYTLLEVKNNVIKVVEFNIK